MDESPSIDCAIPSRLVSSMDGSPLIDCFFWSMDESPLIGCTAAGSFEIVVSCPVFEAILLPYRLTSFRVSERLKIPLAIPMCTVPYQSNTNPYSNFLSRGTRYRLPRWKRVPIRIMLSLNCSSFSTKGSKLQQNANRAPLKFCEGPLNHSLAGNRKSMLPWICNPTSAAALLAAYRLQYHPQYGLSMLAPTTSSGSTLLDCVLRMRQIASDCQRSINYSKVKASVRLIALRL